jgi:hemerythrin superfamily protein
MDAFELLKADHRKVEALFKEIESAPSQSKADLFTQLKSELDRHANIEEAILYPALENSEETRDITLEAYEEHKVVKEMLAQLESATPDETWSAKLSVLRENVEHHVEEEEGELFSKARRVLSDEALEDLGDEIDAAKTAAEPVRAATAPDAQKVSRKASKPSKPSPDKTKRPGLLGTLAKIVGLGTSSDEADGKRGAKTGRKLTAKSSGKGTTKKAATKSAAKKSSKTGASSNKSTAKKTAAKRARKKPASSKKAGKRVAVRSSSNALKRSSKKKALKTTKRSGGSKKR